MKCPRCCMEIDNNTNYCSKCGLDLYGNYIPEEYLKEMKDNNYKSAIIGTVMGIHVCISALVLLITFIFSILCALAYTEGIICKVANTNVFTLMCEFLALILPIIISIKSSKTNEIISIPFILLIISDIIIVVSYISYMS